eukprot:SAG25_NODE_1439_length_3023_cov_1.781806_2_plen_306_part_00
MGNTPPSAERAASSQGHMAVALDKDMDEPEHAMEKVFSAAVARAKEAADQPLGMARSVPWEYFHTDVDGGSPGTATASGGAPALDGAAFLTELLSAPADEDSVHSAALLEGPPRSRQFANRHLPGDVRLHSWDHHPTNASLWEVEHPEGCDDWMPTVELARAHPGDLPQDDCSDGLPGSVQESYPKGKFAPLTTKAGSRLWSIGFVAPPPTSQRCDDHHGGAKPSVEVLRAAYQMQLLVRIDMGRQAIVYDAFDYLPTTEKAWNDAQAEGQVNTLCTWDIVPHAPCRACHGSASPARADESRARK